MPNNLFSQHLRMLAFVPRWQIAPRFRTQNVAEHNFFVALYTMQLLEYVPRWDSATQQCAIECALMHDIPEARTGDMPGPVKRAVVDPDKLAEFEHEQMQVMGLEKVEYPDHIVRLVKVADLIDELFHVVVEISMGNSLMVPQEQITRDRLTAAIRRAGLPWSLEVMIDDQIADLRGGVRLPENRPDTDPLTPALDFNADEEIPF